MQGTSVRPNTDASTIFRLMMNMWFSRFLWLLPT